MLVSDAAHKLHTQFHGFSHLQSLSMAVCKFASTSSVTFIIPTEPAVLHITDSEIAECDTAELVQDHKEVVREWQ
jgi:hypothetical protein